MSDIDDTINVGTATELLKGTRPMATCPKDGEPLVETFEFRGAEFICMGCGGKFGFLSPAPKPWTQALQDQHDAHRVQYLVERAERDAAVS